MSKNVHLYLGEYDLLGCESDVSINEQKSLLEEYSKKNNYVIISSVEKSNDESVLDKLIDRMKKGEILIVYSINIFIKDHNTIDEDLIFLVAKLNKKGCSLKTIKESLDTETGGGKFIAHTLIAKLQYDVDKSKEDAKINK